MKRMAQNRQTRKILLQKINLEKVADYTGNIDEFSY